MSGSGTGKVEITGKVERYPKIPSQDMHEKHGVADQEVPLCEWCNRFHRLYLCGGHGCGLRMHGMQSWAVLLQLRGCLASRPPPLPPQTVMRTCRMPCSQPGSCRSQRSGTARLGSGLFSSQLDRPVFSSQLDRPWCRCREIGFASTIFASIAQPISVPLAAHYSVRMSLRQCLPQSPM